MTGNGKVASSRRRALAVAAACALAVPSLALAGGDFDGDGFDDVVVGIPNESVDGESEAGAVAVLYFGPSGLARNQLWREGADGLGGTPKCQDEFGRSVAIGDFDADGFDDLAIGIPGDMVAARVGAGAVVVLYGAPDGLAAARSPLFTKDSPGIPLAPSAYDGFGQSLESGDFDGDGFDDLAVGAPSSLGLAGAIHVLFGSPAGLAAAGSRVVAEPGGPVPFALFGEILRSGDFDGDGHDDLAVGLPRSPREESKEAGLVRVLFGSAAGLTADGAAEFRQSAFPAAVDETGDRFGAGLEAADFDGDGFDELAIAAWQGGVGSVHVAHGSSDGLAPRATWTKAAFPGGLPAVGDFFGSSLAAADLTGDGVADLSVGIPGANDRRGAAALLRGGAGAGLAPLRIFPPRVLGGAVPDDLFGMSLAAGDFTGDGRADVAAGMPLDGVGSVRRAGSLTILAQPRAPMTFWHQDSPGVLDDAETGDLFGVVLGR